MPSTFFNGGAPRCAAVPALVKTGGAGKTIACATCHGVELNGIGAAPSIVGRSPSYIVRQIYDIQRGVRVGARIEPMKAAVAQLSEADIVAIAAYVASRSPCALAVIERARRSTPPHVARYFEVRDRPSRSLRSTLLRSRRRERCRTQC